MSMLLALATLPLVPTTADASVPERAVALVTRVCEPFLAGRLAKPDAADTAHALGLKLLSRAGSDFVFLMEGDLALAMGGEGDDRDCSVLADKVSLEAVVMPLRAAASTAKWPEVSPLTKSHLWLTPSHLMAAVDETYDKPDTEIAIRFRKRGAPPVVGGKPADPLNLAATQICIPYSERVIGPDDARDIAIAAGLVARDKAFAGYDIELSFGEIGGVRRCTLTAAPGEALGRRIPALQGPGHAVRVSGQPLVVTSRKAN